MTWAGSIVAFVGVSDLEVAERFYGETLGLDLDYQRPFSLVATVGETRTNAGSGPHRAEPGSRGSSTRTATTSR